MLFANLFAASAAILSIAIYGLGWVVYSRYFHPLKAIPGPFLASVTRLWLFWKTSAGDMDRTQRALHDRYGPLVRIAPDEISCSDPDALKIIYNAKNVWIKSEFYDGFRVSNDFYNGHFVERDERLHSERRKIVNSLYSMNNVLQSEECIDSCVATLEEVMRDFAGQDVPFDLTVWTHRYVFDVLGEVFFGTRFGFMTERRDVGNFMWASEAITYTMSLNGILPSYLRNLYLIAKTTFSSYARGGLGAVRHLEEAAAKALDARRQQLEAGAAEKHDVLRKMIDLQSEKGNTIDFQDPYIKMEALNAIAAGADSTSATLNSVFYHLMKTPAAYSKLVAEIDQAYADGALSDSVTYAEAARLPYLRACISEAMRIHAPFALSLPRIVPAGGAVVSGTHIPGGYVVGVNAAIVQRDKAVFGPDADTFNPDRWIEGDHARMERTMFQFGGGTHVCIGKNIALSEIYKLVPQLLRKFHFRLVDPTKEWTAKNIFLHIQSDVNCLVEERS